MRVLTLLQVTKGGREDFGQWLTQEYAPRLRTTQHELSELRVNLAVDPPPGLTLYGSDENNSGLMYDAVLECTVDTREGWVAIQQMLVKESPVPIVVDHAYAVSSRTVMQRPSLEQGLPTAGYKLIRGLYLYDDLPDVAAQRLWQHHEKLAVKVHVGLGRYARHWVDERLTPDAPAVRGFSDLHFPDADSMMKRYFDSPRGREEILHDIGHFIQGGLQRVFSREYVFLSLSSDETVMWKLSRQIEHCRTDPDNRT